MIQSLQPIPSFPLGPTQDNSIYIQTFLECEGNLPLAIEKLDTTRAKFLYELSQDPPQLQQAIRTLLLVNLAHSFTKIQTVLLSLSDHLEPAEAAKAYTSIAQALATITTPTSNQPTVQLNNQFNFNQLPPEVKQAISILQSTDSQ